MTARITAKKWKKRIMFLCVNDQYRETNLRNPPIVQSDERRRESLGVNSVVPREQLHRKSVVRVLVRSLSGPCRGVETRDIALWRFVGFWELLQKRIALGKLGSGNVIPHRHPLSLSNGSTEGPTDGAGGRAGEKPQHCQLAPQNHKSTQRLGVKPLEYLVGYCTRVPGYP